MYIESGRTASAKLLMKREDATVSRVYGSITANGRPLSESVPHAGVVAVCSSNEGRGTAARYELMLDDALASASWIESFTSAEWARGADEGDSPEDKAGETAAASVKGAADMERKWLLETASTTQADVRDMAAAHADAVALALSEHTVRMLTAELSALHSAVATTDTQPTRAHLAAAASGNVSLELRNAALRRTAASVAIDKQSIVNRADEAEAQADAALQILQWSFEERHSVAAASSPSADGSNSRALHISLGTFTSRSFSPVSQRPTGGSTVGKGRWDCQAAIWS
jgi:hypothetical protein